MGVAMGVYITCLAQMAWALIWLTVCDLWLHFHGEPTVSDFLTLKPEWLVWVVASALAGVCLLCLHLAWRT